MWHKTTSAAAPLLPGISLGLFTGRLLSEQWTIHYGISPIAPLLLTGILCFLALFILRRHPFQQTWPLLLLLVYVIYPHPFPAAAGAAVLLAVSVIFQLILVRTHLFSSQRTLNLAAATITLLFSLLYIFTLAPGLLPADSGEFQLVGATLGIAHPPGFPLYTLLSQLMTWLPLPTTAAYKINLLSAFTSAIALGILYLTVFRLTKRHLAATTAVLSLGTATTYWAQATTANIRSLTALFALMAFFALIRHAQEKDRTDRYLILFAAALSLGFTHHLSLVFMGLIFFLTLWLIDPGLFRTPLRWKRPLLAALVGLIPLVYLPLRAGADVPGAQESLATAAGFLNHFLALGFQGDFFYFVQPAVFGPRLQVMANILTLQFSPWLLAGALLGWLWLTGQNWRLGLLFGGSFALHTLATATYRAPQTVEYMLPAYLPIAISLGVASGRLSEIGRKLPPALGWLPLVTTAVLFVTALGQGWQRWPSFVWLHQSQDTRLYAKTILDSAPANGLILANWHWATPLWYLQTVEGARPDVTIHYVAPGSEPYSQTWANRIAIALADGRSVIATFIDDAAYSNLPPAEPIGEALLFRQAPRTELPAGFTPLALDLNDQVQILGFRLESPEVEIGQETRLAIAWQAVEAVPFFVHLLDEEARIVAQADLTGQPRREGITLTQFHLTPRQGPGMYTLRLGSGEEFSTIGELKVAPASLPPATQHPVYRPVVSGASSQTLIGYDWDNTLPDQLRLYLHWQDDEGYISTVVDEQPHLELPNLLAPWGLSGPAWPVPISKPDEYYVPLGQGIVWTGVSLADLEAGLWPGSKARLPMNFINGRPLLRDYVVSTRLVGYEADGFTWAWCDLIDSIPAMGGIPTLKWIQGSRVQSPRTILFPPQEDPARFSGFCQSVKPAPGAPIHYVAHTATTGQKVGGLLRLYDAFTKRPLPILDGRIVANYSWIPLGETVIEDEKGR